MSEKDLTMEEWNPDWEENPNSVWAAEWYGPDEPIPEEELEQEFIMMTYKGKDTWRWHFPEIQAAIECENGIDTLLEKYKITDATAEDKEELFQFLSHYIWFVTMDSKKRPAREFVAEDAIEEIGDDMLSEMDEEYAKLGQQSELTKAIKRTLH